MNSRDRVLAALRLEEPDRVPIFEWIIDPKVIESLLPGSNLPDFVDKMGLDGVSTGPAFDREYIGDSIYRDEWGVIHATTTEVLGAPLDGPIKCMDDLEEYRLPDPMAEGRLGDLPNYVARFKGEKAIVFHQRAGFMWAAHLRRMDNLLVDFIVNPELARATIDRVVEFSEVLARRAIRAGADIVMLGDDYAYKSGPMMSPQHFRQFILPALSRLVNVIHEEGAFCIKHSDGNIWPLMDMIVDTGIDGLNPIEPTAGMDIGEVKERYGHRVCLIGNIDCGYTLSMARVEEVIKEVKTCLRKAAPGGGFIMMSSNSIHSSVKPENFKAMIKTTHKLGHYPLDIEALDVD